MAVSAFQKVLSRLFRQFTLHNGREPQTPKEWMDLQNDAVRLFNKTKGAPTKPQTPPFQGFKPRVIQGGKKPGIEGIALERFPKETHEFFGRPLKEKDFSKIDELIESGVIKRGEAPKTKLSVVEGKKTKQDEFINKEQWIAKKKQENKEAIERFKKRTQKKTVEDFRDEGDWDPSGFAAGGIAKGARWFINSLKKNLTDMEAGHPRFKGVPAKDQETLKVGYRTFIKELEAGGEVPVEALEAISKNPQYYKTKKVVRSQDPDLAEVEELIDEKVFGDVRQELKDFEVVGRKPQASGGLAYMLGEPTYMKAGGGKVGHGPWTTGQTPQGPQSRPEMPQPQVQGRPDPMKAPRLPNVAPRSMDPQVMQQQRMQQAMMQQQQPRMGMKDGGIKLGPLEIKPRASGSFTEGPYGPDEQRTWEDQIGLDAELDLPWGFELKGEYDKRRIKDRLYSPDDEYLDERVRADDDRWGLELVWKKKFNQGGRVPMMYGGDPGFAFEYGGSWADWHDSHRNQMPIEDYIQTKLPKERLPFRAPMAGGGMTRRAFMKLMASLGALPFIGKGIQKSAPKIIPKVAEVIARDSVGIPTYAFDLIEVVKAKGVQEIIEGVTKKVPATKYSYKGVDVTVHPNGLTEVRKTHTGPGSWTDETGDVLNDEAIHREVGFDIKEGGYEQIGNPQFDDAAKTVKLDDEYFEATVRPDAEGKMKDMEEFIEEADHLDLKKIADEKGTLIIKKASGGLAHMLGE
jgi:hypothetical protein